MSNLGTKNVQEATPFVSVKQAVKITGLSAYYLRNGLRAGTIPHTKSGKKFLINLPALMRELDVTTEGGAD